MQKVCNIHDYKAAYINAQISGEEEVSLEQLVANAIKKHHPIKREGLASILSVETGIPPSQLAGFITLFVTDHGAEYGVRRSRPGWYDIIQEASR